MKFRPGVGEGGRAALQKLICVQFVNNLFLAEALWTNTTSSSATVSLFVRRAGLSSMREVFKVSKGNKLLGYSTIYSLRLRDSRGFCHITFQFSFISDLPLFQIFQILQILKWKWKWKDPTFAIFLKNMGFKDVEYNIPETLRLPRLPRLWDSETLRQKEDKTTKCKNAGPPSTIIEHC